MIAFLKYIKGYVRIRIWGLSPERFMNLCSNRDILLWNIEKDEDIYTMCISLKAFYQLRPIARKTGTRVVILQRVGLPFFVPVILSRKIFCLGLILCVAFWIGSSYFVWDIECSGNYQITDDVMMTFLKEQDVKVGMLKSKLDIEALEKEIRRSFNEVTWTSAKLNGTKLIIDMKENDVPLIPAIKEDQGGKNLIAQYDGTIVSMIVRNGVPKVAIGDVITKGCVLVEGMIPIYNEDTTVREYQYVTSDADIFVRRKMTHQEVLRFDYIKKEYTGREKAGYYFRLGEKEIKFTMERPFLVYDSLIKEQSLRVLKKLDIPVFFGQITYREYQNMEYRYSKEQAKELLLQKINKFFATLEEKGVHIIEKNVRIETEVDQWVLNADLTVEEAVGELIEIPMDDSMENGQSSVEADAVE
ncbi:MAG: sporulation protein YqfD [Lachnospiraceae bacterium]|nr:sporulation protein YqfD [Lachnospiraceae bacterium]